MDILRIIWQFIKGNYKRFAWEVAAILLSIGVTWLINHFASQGDLQACQVNGIALRKSNRTGV